MYLSVSLALDLSFFHQPQQKSAARCAPSGPVHAVGPPSSSFSYLYVHCCQHSYRRAPRATGHPVRTSLGCFDRTFRRVRTGNGASGKVGVCVCVCVCLWPKPKPTHLWIEMQPLPSPPLLYKERSCRWRDGGMRGEFENGGGATHCDVEFTSDELISALLSMHSSLMRRLLPR